MLNRMNQVLMMPCEAPKLAQSEDKWQRNEREDMKIAIDALYEFREKLGKLHPIVIDAIETLLQRPRY